jgi:hypothetical protein
MDENKGRSPIGLDQLDEKLDYRVPFKIKINKKGPSLIQ